MCSRLFIVMNYTEARNELMKGEKIKLPEWVGYWYGEPHPVVNKTYSKGDKVPMTIMVLTGNGDILDTPHIDRYEDRDDWEITDGSLGFDFAIRALKNGKKVERAAWKVIVPRQWVSMISKRFYIASSGQGVGALLGEGDKVNVLPHFVLYFRENMCVPWVPQHPDMLSNDWQLKQD